MAQSIEQLYKSLQSLCAPASDVHAHYFAAVDEQLDYLFYVHLPSLEQWYLDQFVPAMRQYERSNGKSVVQAARDKQLAELYGKTDELADKAFECINKAICYSPQTETDFLCNCYYFRSELHRFFGNDVESASSDMAKALHYRPKSFTCINSLVNRLIQLNRHSEAHRVVENSLKWHSTQMSASKIEMLKQMKENLASYMTHEEMPLNGPSKRHRIWVDSRMEMVRNEDNRRFYFRAKRFIPAGENLIEEQPSMFVLKQGGRHVYCSSCLKSCPTTFLPCAKCIEVVFCSESCLNASMNGEHRAECGIIGLMQSQISSKAAQTYRLLAQSGHVDLLAMNESTTAYSPENYFPEAQLKTDHEEKSVIKWFQLAQCDLRAQVQHRSPSRTSEELASAIFVYALYRYQMKPEQIGSEQVTQLIGLLATDIAKVRLTQFSWHETINKTQLSIGSFQCLIGSHITHACEENANWSYVNGNLKIMSKENIELGQPITISYGLFGNRSFYRRQEQMQTFSVACNCPKCAREVSKNFALRCLHCSTGPVPFATDKVTANTSIACMRCDRRYMNVTKAQEVVQQFCTTQRLIWLVQAIDSEHAVDAQNAQYLMEISNRMNHLAGHIYPYYTQWLHVIANILELFCGREWFDQAVSWLQWLVERFDIYLAYDQHVDSLEQLHQLDLWTSAYTAYIAQTADEQLSESMTKHISTGEQFFQKTFEVLNTIAMRTDIDQLVEDKKAMVKALYQAARDKWNQFTEITLSKMVIPLEEGELLVNFDENLEFLATADELEEDEEAVQSQEDEDSNKGSAQSKPVAETKQNINQSGEDNSLEDGNDGAK